MNVSPSILVVNDEKLIADTLAVILRNAGYEPFVAYNGPSALILAQQVEPDIVLSDVILPGMNGLELTAKIREIMPDTRVFLISGQAITGEMLEEAKKSGQEFEVLPKPIDPEDLLARLKE